MMSEDLDQAAAYALGISRGAARAAIEARHSSDPALFWVPSLSLDSVLMRTRQPPVQSPPNQF